MYYSLLAFFGLLLAIKEIKLFLIYKKMKEPAKIVEGAEPFFYKRGKKGVILIHGFTSSAADFRDLGKYLADKNITVSAVLLPGHGTSPERLAVRKAKDWYRCLEKEYNKMKKICDKVYIGGLSFGGNLAINFSVEHEVDGLILLGTPIFFRKETILKIMFYISQLVKTYQKKWYSKKLDRKIWEKRRTYDRIPLKTVFEVMSEWKKSKQNVGKITSPLLVMSSTKDHAVDDRTVEYLVSKSKSLKTRVVWIKDVYHVFVVDKKKKESFKGIYGFVRDN